MKVCLSRESRRAERKAFLLLKCCLNYLFVFSFFSVVSLICWKILLTRSFFGLENHEGKVECIYKPLTLILGALVSTGQLIISADLWFVVALPHCGNALLLWPLVHAGCAAELTLTQVTTLGSPTCSFCGTTCELYTVRPPMGFGLQTVFDGDVCTNCCSTMPLFIFRLYIITSGGLVTYTALCVCARFVSPVGLTVVVQVSL